MEKTAKAMFHEFVDAFPKPSERNYGTDPDGKLLQWPDPCSPSMVPAEILSEFGRVRVFVYLCMLSWDVRELTPPPTSQMLADVLELLQPNDHALLRIPKVVKDMLFDREVYTSIFYKPAYRTYMENETVQYVHMVVNNNAALLCGHMGDQRKFLYQDVDEEHRNKVFEEVLRSRGTWEATPAAYAKEVKSQSSKLKHPHLANYYWYNNQGGTISNARSLVLSVNPFGDNPDYEQMQLLNRVIRMTELYPLLEFPPVASASIFGDPHEGPVKEYVDAIAGIDIPTQHVLMRQYSGVIGEVPDLTIMGNILNAIKQDHTKYGGQFGFQGMTVRPLIITPLYVNEPGFSEPGMGQRFMHDAEVESEEQEDASMHPDLATLVDVLKLGKATHNATVDKAIDALIDKFAADLKAIVKQYA